MANLSFEGLIEGISEIQLDYIKNVLKDGEFDGKKVTVEAVGKAGDNWQANVKRFIVEKNGKTFKMIAKIAPTNEMLRVVSNSAFTFQNEHIFYIEVIPKFTELEKEANIPEQDKLRYARCYGSFTEKPNEVILLEDLAMADYLMLDRFENFTDETMKLVLKALAHYHSLSYVFKNREPECFNALATKLMDPLQIMIKTDMIAMYAGQMEQAVLAVLQSERDLNLVKGSITSLKDIKVELDPKYSVIKQGDAWTNNLMFKLKDGKPSECCMIDYQQCALSSPAFDLHFMIFNCSDLETRSTHYQQWIDYYHSEVKRSLNYFGLNVAEIYPKEQLEAELKAHGRLSFGLAILLAGMSTKDSSEAAAAKEVFEKGGNMDELMKMAAGSSMLRFKNKVEGIIESFVQLGYLD